MAIGKAAGNTGITGGIKGVPNNKVPTQSKKEAGNTGITGGIKGVPNNKVPKETREADQSGKFDKAPGWKPTPNKPPSAR